MMRKLALTLLYTLLATGIAAAQELHIPKTMLGRDCLFGSRLVKVNRESGKAFSNGQMKEQPLLVSFGIENDTLLIIRQKGYTDAQGVSWKTRVANEKLFELGILSDEGDALRVDATSLLRTYPLAVTVITPKELKGDATCSELLQAVEDEELLSVLMDYSYSDGLEAEVLLFFLALKDEPEALRRLDEKKIGYNSLEYRDIGGNKVQKAQRWLLADGRKIRFYVDRAFPAAWFKYIKEGIEDWNKAFEAVGLGSVLEVLPEPQGLDRNSPLVNMVRFIPGKEANAKGQVLVDPRSGEILQADIFWWEGVTGLLKDWRYIQTGASDPDARLLDYPLEMFGPMIRHAVCHEAGHVLGLSHNMGASFAYTPEQLRDRDFTAVYGTSASVMDYARYNHIASAEDVRNGVNLLPPRIGPYDMYAIAEGYSESGAIPGEYCFFSPFISAAISPDPSSQSESLSNDLLYSSARGLENCRDLLCLDGLNDERKDLIKKYYYRYIHLTLANIGGSVHGMPVPMRLQRATVDFVLKNLENVPAEIRDAEEEKRILGELNGNFLPKRIAENHGHGQRGRYQQRLERNKYYKNYKKNEHK
ncbi:MAG: zinc-dependent metalloprotease [Bacteroidales bacterium]|nr:zinc-dependent metalloprotease [Bacteroidales bacterium]